MGCNEWSVVPQRLMNQTTIAYYFHNSQDCKVTSTSTFNICDIPAETLLCTLYRLADSVVLIQCIYIGGHATVFTVDFSMYDLFTVWIYPTFRNCM